MKEIKDFFKFWSNVERDDIEMKSLLFKYYLENGFEKYLSPASQLILSARLPQREFEKITYSSILASLDNKKFPYIILLFNYEPLLNALSSNQKKHIYNYVQSNKDFLNLEKELINDTQLFKQIKDEFEQDNSVPN